MTLVADTIHVPADQPTIQAGIDAAVDGDTVLVAGGTYTGPGNKNLDYGGKALTVRSENGPDSCIIDCEYAGRGFTFTNGEAAGALVAGFTVRNGDVDGWKDHASSRSPYDGGAILCDAASPTIINCTFVGNEAYEGGGVALFDSGAVIDGCLFSSNYAFDGGGGIHVVDSSPVVGNCRFINNGGVSIFANGGGISAYASTLIVRNSLFLGNLGHYGGGLMTDSSWVAIEGCTMHDNLAEMEAGGVYSSSSTVEVRDSIIRENGFDNIVGTLTATYSNLHDFGGGNWPGEGNINVDPLFATGPEGDHYLSQVAAGQPVDSPCVDAGDPASVVLPGTTRTDLVQDDGVVDMGYHHPLAPGLYSCYQPQHYSLESVSGGGPVEHTLEIWSCTGELLAWSVSDDAAWLSLDPAAGTSTGEVDDVALIVDPGSLPPGEYAAEITVEATGAINTPCFIPVSLVITPGEEEGRLVIGPGPADDHPPRVRVFPAEQDAAHLHEFTAYGAPHWGVNVSSGDVNGDLQDEILTGPGPGDIYGPHLRGFQQDGTPLPGLSFFAFGTPRFGVNVAAGDLDGDGRDEILAGAGPGAVFGPHVRAFTYDGSSVTPLPGVSFFAYGTRRWGVNVACGDLDGDGVDEILTGPGPGSVFGPHVRGWNVDGGTVTAMPGCSFFAYGTHKYGVNVSCGDVDGDGIDEVITGPGPSLAFGAHTRGFEMDGSPMPGLSFFAWPPSVVRYGARVFAGADLNGNGRNEIVVGQGPDPEASGEVKVFEYDGSGVTLWFSLEGFPSMTHGTNVAAGQF